MTIDGVTAAMAIQWAREAHSAANLAAHPGIEKDFRASAAAWLAVAAELAAGKDARPALAAARAAAAEADATDAWHGGREGIRWDPDYERFGPY
jgi:hypothetical protein